MNTVMNALTDLLHLFFPKLCAGCGTDLLHQEEQLCMACRHALPRTGFNRLEDNPVNKIFRGRVPLEHATACFYFSKEGLMQRLVHACKYKDQRELAVFLGRCMGEMLLTDAAFPALDIIIPVPLFRSRERKRGYNQSALLAEGIGQQLKLPVVCDAVCRTKQTDTQTRKSRIERWENVSDVFRVKNASCLKEKRILLVDDVITTGATLEACAACILAVEKVQLYAAALAWAGE